MKRSFILTSILLIAALLLSACTETAAPTEINVVPLEPTATPVPAVEEPAVEEPAATQEPATEEPMATAIPASEALPATLRLPDLGGQTVVAVTGNDYTPLNFVDPLTGEAVGWEYDAVNEICRRLNCVVDWQVTAWDTMIAAVKEGQFDVGMDGITITDERGEQVDFSNA